MPILPDYRADQGLDFGRVPNVDIGAGYISQGMGKLASGLDQAAQGLQSYQQKQELAQKFDVNQIHSLTQEKIQTALQEYEKTAPANGVGFTEGFLKVAKPIQDEFLKQVPDNLKPQYLRQIQIDNQNILQTTTAKGDALRTTWDTSQINDNISKYETRVMGDPSQRDAALSDLKHSIDLAPSLTPQQKELAKKNVQATIEAAQAKGLYPDPQDMAKALGVPTAETRAAAQTKVPLIDGNATTTSRAQAAMSYLVGRGYSKVGAAGIVGNLVQESSLNPGSNNPHDGADGSDSIGVGQWNGARAAAFKQFAAAQGKPLNDLGVQLAFLDHELSTQYAGVKTKLMQATTPDEAAAIMVTGYEKPRGSEGGAVASDGWARRRDSARMLAGGTYNPADVKLDTSQPQGVPVGGDPRFANIPFDQRQTLVNWAATQQNQAQAIARGNLEPVVQDATAAYLTTGSYGGQTPTQQDFVKAYGAEQGGQKFIEFQKVQQIGQQVDQFKTMTPDQISATVAAAKPVSNGEGFADAQSKYEALTKAAAVNLKARQDDPAGYVSNIYPAVGAAWKDNTPGGFERALKVSAAAQSKLGIPDDQQKWLPQGSALSLAQNILKSSDPKAVMDSLEKESGAAWPKVFSELVSEGKLPTGYQALSILPPTEAAYLAMALKPLDPNDGGKGASWMDRLGKDAAGHEVFSTIKDVISADPTIVSLRNSMHLQGVPDNTIDSMMKDVETLAAAHVWYDRKDSATAAGTAIKAFTDMYQFMPIENGGARIPAAKMQDTSAAIGALMDGLTPDQIKAPSAFGQVDKFGQASGPSKEDYIAALKANPMWVNTPKADGVTLLDHAMQPVIGKDGKPVTVLFDQPAAPAPTPQAAPSPPVQADVSAPAAPAPAIGGKPVVPPPVTEKSPAADIRGQVQDLRKGFNGGGAAELGDNPLPAMGN